MNKKLALLISVLLMYAICVAQTDKPLRVELEASPGNPDYEVITAGQYGLLLINTSDRKSEKGKTFYKTIRYDENLQKSKLKEITVNSPGVYQSHLLRDSVLAMLFFDNEGKNEGALYDIVMINMKNGGERIISGKLPVKTIFKEWQQLNDHFIIAAEAPKGKIILTLINAISGQSADIPVTDGDGSLRALVADTMLNRVLLLVSSGKNKNETCWLKSFTAKGRQIFSSEVKPEGNKEFNQMMILPVDSHHVILAGTYVHQNEKINAARAQDQVNTGFFTANVEDSIVKSMSFYNFIEYKNFYNYISQEELIKIRKKAEKKGLNENEFSLNYKLLLHAPERINGNFILIAEVYNAEYRTVTRTTVDFYGRPMPETYTVFDGYRMLNTLVFAFNDSSRYAWDNNFEMYDLLDFDLYPRIGLLADSADMVLAYNNDGKLVYKVIEKGFTLVGPEHIKVETCYNSDKLSDEKKNRLVYWYDDYLLAYGYQQIKNHILPGRNARSVFYLNKIGYK